MDNSPSPTNRPTGHPFFTQVDGQQEPAQEGDTSNTQPAVPGSSPPRMIPPRQSRPVEQTYFSSDEDSVEEMWRTRPRRHLQAEPQSEPVLDEAWLVRLSPLARFCCTAVHLHNEEGPDAVFAKFKALLDAGENLHAVDQETGRNLLHWACYGGCPAVVAALGDLLGDEAFDVVDTHGKTPLCVAVDSPVLMNPAPIVEWMLEQGAELSALPNKGGELVHVEWLTIPIAMVLVRKGIDIDAPDRHGNTALRHACAGIPPNLPLASYLLEHGANPNRTGLFRRTVMHDGSLSWQAASLLFSKGALVDEPDEQGMTPLMYACSENNIALAEFLIGKGASPFKASVDGANVLGYARDAGESMEFFIRRRMGILPDIRPAGPASE